MFFEAPHLAMSFADSVKVAYECRACLGPKIPFTTLFPCGHEVCGRCATNMNGQCTFCLTAITSVVESHELSEQVRLGVIYTCKTPSCNFRGPEAAAKKHVCREFGLRELGPHLTDDDFETVFTALRSGVPEDDIIDRILDLEYKLRQKGEAQAAGAHHVAATEEPSAAVGGGTEGGDGSGAFVYWDYDNIRPRYIAPITVAAFHEKLLRALKNAGVVVRSCDAYLTEGKDYRNDPRILQRLQVMPHWTSVEKRSLGDHDLTRDLRAHARELEQAGTRGIFVVVSTDKDFIDVVRDLKEHHDVWLVHNARKSSAHEKRLTEFPKGTIPVSSFVDMSSGERAALAADPHQKVTVRDQEVVRSWLLPNQALDRADGEPLMWCDVEVAHDLTACSKVHVAEGYVVANRRVEPASNFVANRGLSEAVSRVAMQCSLTSDQVHDEMQCRFLHRGLRIRDQTVPASWFVRNRALDRIALGQSFLWCTNRKEHDFTTCDYAHVQAGYVVANLHAEPTSNFIPNAGVQNLEKNSRLGLLCRITADPTHDQMACPFLHRRSTPDQEAVPEPALVVTVPAVSTDVVQRLPDAEETPRATTLHSDPDHPSSERPSTPLLRTRTLPSEETAVSSPPPPPPLTEVATLPKVEPVKSTHSVTAVQATIKAAPAAIPAAPVRITVVVNGAAVFVNDLRPSKGLEILTASSDVYLNGSMCALTQPHSVADCAFIHRRFTPEILVRQDPSLAPVNRKATRFIYNAGWHHVQEFPVLGGRLCTRKAYHDVDTCMDLHETAD